MGRVRICPRCSGTGRLGEDLCRACNPSGAVGDRIVGLGQRVADRATGRSLRLTAGGVVATNRGRHTVTALPADMIPPGKRKSHDTCVRCQRTGPLKWTGKGGVCLHGCPTENTGGKQNTGGKGKPAKQQRKAA